MGMRENILRMEQFGEFFPIIIYIFIRQFVWLDWGGSEYITIEQANKKKVEKLKYHTKNISPIFRTFLYSLLTTIKWYTQWNNEFKHGKIKQHHKLLRLWYNI